MRFKEGDQVEFIYRNKKSVGVINRVYPEKQAVGVIVNGCLKVLIPDKAIAKVEEQERVVVPQFVADWIIHCRQHEYDLVCLLDYEYSDMSYEMDNWLHSEESNQELLVRAWLDGYEVEKEPLYYVHFLEGIGGYLNMRYDGLMRTNGKDQDDEYKTQFTEAEIKSMKKGKGYWLLREPVDELEGEA
ncbi:DUF1642 domain-containing protein [Listeria monocytogenes]|uniref:DUF1642 domain-containing protein n=1 Tax=Listeria monocytogenes TaxID=1639 RepID=UPI0011EB3861|nr:DUF1642 domain-containing protein [Listeria monocytogenes]TYU82188.1 DUF1642 domain-containing protein [Listeria monocytogenes]